MFQVSASTMSSTSSISDISQLLASLSFKDDEIRTVFINVCGVTDAEWTVFAELQSMDPVVAGVMLSQPCHKDKLVTLKAISAKLGRFLAAAKKHTESHDVCEWCVSE